MEDKSYTASSLNTNNKNNETVYVFHFILVSKEKFSICVFSDKYFQNASVLLNVLQALRGQAGDPHRLPLRPAHAALQKTGVLREGHFSAVH